MKPENLMGILYITSVTVINLLIIIILTIALVKLI